MEVTTENYPRRLLAINFLYTFITSALAFILPLYLLSLGFDLGITGALISSLPLTFLIFRIVFASLADDIGTASVGFIYSSLTLLSVGFYAFFISPIGFAIASFTEGFRASAFWAIVRTETVSAVDQKQAAPALAFFSAIRTFSEGLGKITIGALLAYLSFQNALYLLIALSFVLFALVVFPSRKDIKHPRLNQSFLPRIFKSHPVTFWQAAALLALLWVPINVLMTFLLPIYLRTFLGFSFMATGTLIAILSIAAGIAQFLSMRSHLGNKNLLLLCLLMIPALLVITHVASDVTTLFILLAIGIGAATIITEYVISDQALRSKDFSTDVGVLFVPLKLFEFLFVFFGGFTISIFGYPVLFSLCAMMIVLFVIFGWKLICPVTLRVSQK
jgi:MFS family permease